MTEPVPSVPARPQPTLTSIAFCKAQQRYARRPINDFPWNSFHLKVTSQGYVVGSDWAMVSAADGVPVEYGLKTGKRRHSMSAETINSSIRSVYRRYVFSWTVLPRWLLTHSPSRIGRLTKGLKCGSFIHSTLSSTRAIARA